jgi:hypothetical protein
MDKKDRFESAAVKAMKEYMEAEAETLKGDDDVGIYVKKDVLKYAIERVQKAMTALEEWRLDNMGVIANAGYVCEIDDERARKLLEKQDEMIRTLADDLVNVLQQRKAMYLKFEEMGLSQHMTKAQQAEEKEYTELLEKGLDDFFKGSKKIN